MGAALASLFGVAACSSNPIVQTRTVTVYAPAACQPAAGSAFALFQPLGDFEPPENPPSVLLTNTNVGAILAGFPADTMELVADVTDATSAHWAAHALLASSGDVDLLALPASPCALSDTITAHTGAVLGAIDEGHVLVVGGTKRKRRSPDGAHRSHSGNRLPARNRAPHSAHGGDRHGVEQEVPSSRGGSASIGGSEGR